MKDCPSQPAKRKMKAPLPTLGAALFFMSDGPVSVSAPAAERHHAAARTKGPDRPTSGPAPQPTSRARRSFPSRTLHPKAGGTRGIREAPPKKRQAEAKRHPGMDLSHAIPSKADRKPEAPAKAANRGEGGTEGKEGKEEGKGRRKGRRKGGRKPESRKTEKLGSRKPESGEAGKPGSREAGKRAEA